MIRKAAVAGAFYPGNPKMLEQMILEFLSKAPNQNLKNLKGIIVPHAGYIYSGPTAAYAYKQLLNLPAQKYNVFILGPAHYVFTTASVGNFEAFETPFGEVKVNRQICEELMAANEELEFNEEAHLPEHSLEVQIPFLQKTLKNFEIIPLVLGEISPELLTKALDPYFLKHDSLFVFSSDLSHYQPYEIAQNIDHNTLQKITALDIKNESEIDACGSMDIKVAMRLAKKHSCRLQLLDYRNSGDTAGDKNGVVGYSAIAMTQDLNSQKKD